MIYDQLLKFSSLFFIFANEYENKLKEKLIREQSKIEKDDEQNDRGSLELTLLQHDLIPIEPGRYGHESSFLGAGGSFQVYRVIWKGKLAVAKLTFNKDQFQKVIRFSELRNKLPEKYKKHIPIIFDIIEDDQNKEYIIVMEELRKINIHISDSIKYGFNKELVKRKIQHLIENIDLIIRSILTDSELERDYSNVEYQQISSQIIFFIKNETSSLFRAKDNNELDGLKYHLCQKLTSFIASNLQASLVMAKYISNKYYNILSKLFATGCFPEEEFQNETVHVELPETKSLLEFLKYLKFEFGIKWSDLRSENIMERPGTRDLVISDPGNFYGL